MRAPCIFIVNAKIIRCRSAINIYRMPSSACIKIDGISKICLGVGVLRELPRPGNALQQGMQNKSLADQRGGRIEPLPGRYTKERKCADLRENCAAQHDGDRGQNAKPYQSRAGKY